MLSLIHFFSSIEFPSGQVFPHLFTFLLPKFSQAKLDEIPFSIILIQEWERFRFFALRAQFLHVFYNL